jgi:hypothetical protein
VIDKNGNKESEYGSNLEDLNWIFSNISGGFKLNENEYAIKTHKIFKG